MDNDLFTEIFGAYATETISLIEKLASDRGTELAVISKEYIDEILKIANLDSKDCTVLPESVWAYVIGVYYGIKVAKDKEGEK